MEAKGFWGHFDGSDPRPTLSSPATNAEIAAEAQWMKDERSAKSLLTQKIPDGTLMRIHTKTIVKLRWDAIVLEYTEKGDYTKTEMRAKFLESKCPEKGDTRDFLMDLRVKREELAKVGVSIDDKDYLSTIISSLPLSLSNFAAAQLAAARMFSASKSIDPDILISLLMEEADRQKSQKARRHGSKKGTDTEGDEAFSAEKKGRKGKREVECWGCREKGHIRRNCPKSESKSSDKKDEGDKDVEPEAAGAAESDLEGEGAWCMEEDLDSVNFEGAVQGNVSISQISDAEKEGDWFLDAIKEQEELEAAEKSAAVLVTESEEKQVSTSFEEAEGEVDWFSQAVEECGEANEDGWDSDDELSAEDYPDLSRRPHVANEPVTPTSSCPIGAGELVVDVPDSAEHLEPTERDTEQMLDVYGNPLYPQVTGGSDYSIAIVKIQKSGGSNYSIANVFQPLGQPDDTHPLGDHKGGGLRGNFVGGETNNSSATHFEGEYDELGETAPDVPSIPSIYVPDNPENPPGVQSSTTKPTKLDFEGEGMGNGVFIERHIVL